MQNITVKIFKNSMSQICFNIFTLLLPVQGVKVFFVGVKTNDTKFLPRH